MSHDTLGDCPLCGHKESSYEDWKLVGYSHTDGHRGANVRVFRCVHCSGKVTTDDPLTPGKAVAFAPLLVDRERRMSDKPHEFARMAVTPVCPKCGLFALFVTRSESVESLVLVRCQCGWEGISRESIEQPVAGRDLSV